MRLIDADILDKALTSLRFTTNGELAHWGDRKDWCLHGSEIEMLIANAPTIEAEPIRHGRWIHNGFMEVKCNNCGNVFHELEDTNYCPSCGASMDKGET